MCHRQDPRCLVLSCLVSSSERLRPTGSPTRQFAMSRVPGFSLLALLAVLTALVSATSHVALFTDAHCQDSYKALDGPNGYPNGTCTDMRRSGEYGSLQVVGLDPGCAGTPCSFCSNFRSCT